MRCQPGDASEVAEDTLDLLVPQLAELRELWEDDDRVAVHAAAPWRHAEVRETETNSLYF